MVARDNGLLEDRARLNIVMMGQGEPLLNLNNVLKATRLLTDDEGAGIFAAAHDTFDGRHHSSDRRDGTSPGAAQAGHFVECLDRGDAAAIDADHAANIT